MLTIRKVYKADELRRFKERLQANPDEVFRMVTQRTGRKTNGQN